MTRSSIGMRIAVLQHVPFEGPAAVAEWFRLRGHTVTVYPLWAARGLPRPGDFDLLVVMGGPMGVYDTDAHPWLVGELRLIAESVKRGIPTLGICLGAQLLAAALGARVYPGRWREIGWWPVEFEAAADDAPPRWRPHLLRLPARATVLHWHGDTFDLPPGAIRLASSRLYPNQAFLYRDHALGLQFHLESTPSSVAALTRASAAEIGGGPGEPAPARAPADLQAGAIRHGGYARTLLALFLEALSDPE